MANLKDKIMIHVIDDHKKSKKDFEFSRVLLIKYMKYFEKCLKNISSSDEIDISIHCDASIFEWLLNYINQLEQIEARGWQLNVQVCNGAEEASTTGDSQHSGDLPKLEVKTAVSILISSDFLKIDRLVNECIDFIV